MNEAIDQTHDPGLSSWVDSANGHDQFPIQNLPLGIVSRSDGRPHAATAIGDMVLDLSSLELPSPLAEALADDTLNRLFALAPQLRLELRRRLSRLLSDSRSRLTVEPHLHRAAECRLHLPAAVGDFTDFYAGIHHAVNVGRQFRPDNPLLPNYKHVPIGYHGRSSSIRPSATPVRRPRGQLKPAGADAPVFGPTERLDYELELGAWIGPGNALGEPIPIAEAAGHIVGLCLLNDWSARDIQAWEYQPLGPFLAKSFMTSVSPWVVTAEALAPFRVPQPPRPSGDPRPLDYLWDEADQRRGALSIELEVRLSSERMREAGVAAQQLSRSAALHLYWTLGQLVAHHSSNGCNLQPGDLIGTGTISAPDERGPGSLLELSRGGAQPVALPGGEQRSFLEDGDELVLTAAARAPGRVPIGFGECRGRVLPAHS